MSLDNIINAAKSAFKQRNSSDNTNEFNLPDVVNIFLLKILLQQWSNIKILDPIGSSRETDITESLRLRWI